MSRTRYHIDLRSLTIHQVRLTLKDKLKRVFSAMAFGLVFATVVIIIAYNFFDSPKEKMLLREIEQYKFQYQVLNDRLDRMSVVLNDLQQRDDNIYRTIFEAEPIPSSVRKAGFGGSDRYTRLEGYDNSDLIIETTKRLDVLSRQMYVQSKSYDVIFEMVKNKSQMLASIPAIQPLSKGTEKIVSGFGYRIHPIYKTLRMHTGIDFAAPKGTPVYATGDGVVVNESGSGYGIVCVIDHGFGYKSLYGHLSKMIVKPGQKVKRGQTIGYVGSTGVSVAPHLHYEVIRNGNKVNPINFFYNDLSPEEYEKVIEIASRVNQSLS